MLSYSCFFVKLFFFISLSLDYTYIILHFFYCVNTFLKIFLCLFPRYDILSIERWYHIMQNLNINSIHYYVKKNTKDTKFHKYSQKQIDGYYHVISDFLFRVSCTTFSYELRIGKFVILPFLKKDIFCYNIISKRHVYYLIDKYHGKIESFDMIYTDNTISTYSSYIVFICKNK